MSNLLEYLMGSDPTKGIDTFSDEEVLVNTHPPLDQWWISISIGVIFALTLFETGLDGLIGVIILSGSIFAYVYKSWDASRYIVTNQRIKVKKGLIRKTEHELRIGDARTVSTSGRGLRSGGNVSVRTSRQTEAKFGPMTKYQEFANAVRKQIRSYEHGETKGGRDQVEIVDPDS